MSGFCVKGIYASGMVLQRNRINCIFGTAEPETSVSLSFRGNEKSCFSNRDGSWKIEFNPGEAGGPFVLSVKNEGLVIEFTDVFVGEVWLLSGQSNAELPMGRLYWSYREDFSLPKNDFIRMITVPIRFRFDGEQDCVESPKWICASPETLALMSGTGYFFAKKLSSTLNVPVGIVNASQGGSPIISWVDKKTVEDYRGKQPYLESLEKWENPENVANARKQTDEAIQKWQENLYAGVVQPSMEDSGWKDCVVPGEMDEPEGAGLLWLRKEIVLTEEEAAAFNSKKTMLWLGTIIDADYVYINGVEVGVTYYRYPPRRYEVPGGTLHPGSNYIVVKLQKNSAREKICFTPEKPYYLFTEDVAVPPVASRTIESKEPVSVQEGGVCKNLSGTWQMNGAKEVEDRPPELFFEWQPTALYNGMLSPCFNYAISGALWYQGESDALRNEDYEGLLKNMISLWRKKFVYGAKDFPFIIVQLPNWSDGRLESNTTNKSGWSEIRAAESKVSHEVKNCGLAVMIDAGEWNDLHPEKKFTTGTRLAYQALRLSYGKKMPVSPRPKKIAPAKDGVLIDFDTAESRLCSINPNEGEVRGFYFDSGDEKKELRAKIESQNSVKVFIAPEALSKKGKICYLWADSPCNVDLYVKSSDILLPAEPFSLGLEM